MHPILALIGPSKAGKSTLMVEVCRLRPDLVKPVISLLTRPKREDDPKEDLLCEFVTVEELGARERRGRAVSSPFIYAGHFYSHDPIALEVLLQTHIGIWSLAEPAIPRLRAKGYPVMTVKLTRDTPAPETDETRLKLDREREQIPLHFDAWIVNDFTEGGLARTTRKLASFIASLSWP